MDYDSLIQKKIYDLIVLCRADKELYKGFSKFKKKADLVDFIISKGTPLSEQYEESNEDIGQSLEQMFLEPEESNNDLFRARPTREELDKKITEITNKINNLNVNNSVVFDTHDDPEYGMMYRLHKHKIFKKYGNLGKEGEMILFHGTDQKNINDILSDDFSLTVNASHGHRHGKGIYFTNCIDKAMSYSEKMKVGRGAGRHLGPAQLTCCKYIIVSLVHVGDIMVGNMNTGIHPKMTGLNNKTYDTSVDNLISPIQFVKKCNGSYNILGVLKIDMKKQLNPRNMSIKYPTGGSTGGSYNIVPIQQKYNFDICNLEIVNGSDDDIKVYWVPTNINIYDPTLDVRTHGKMMGLIKKGYNNKFIVYKDHRFMCANKIGYVRIIEIDQKKKKVIL